MATTNPESSQHIALQLTINIPPKTKEALRYKCKTCTRAFTRSATLKQHIRKHTGEKPYGCGLCSKAFASLKDMKRHELLHDSERNFICEGKVNVKGADIEWGCGKKFARKDGLVAHLSSPENLCLLYPSTYLSQRFVDGLGYGPVYLRAHGTWTCSSKDPWSSLDEAVSSAGCGRKFEGARPLRDHLFPEDVEEDSKCWTEFLTLCRIEATRRALGRAVKIPRSDEQPKKLHGHHVRYQKINVLDSVLSSGDPGTLLQVKFDAPAEVEHWKHCAMDIGGILITDFNMHLESPPCEDPSYDSIVAVQTYWLEFTVPNPPYPSQVGGLIRLRWNVEGHLSSFSNDYMILGVFMPGDGELVASDEPRRAQLQACMDLNSVWHNGEEIARFVGEVSVTREEHNLWDEDWRKKWY